MEEALLTFIIIIILFIILTKKKETFVIEFKGSNRQLFIKNLEHIFGKLLDKKNIKVQQLQNSKKIMVRNLTKLLPINNFIFNHNFNFNNIEDELGNINSVLTYSLKPLDPKTNIYSGYFISPNLNTLEVNKNYGFYLEFNPEKELNNFAEITIDFHKNTKTKINVLKSKKKIIDSDSYFNKERRSINIYNKNNTPIEFEEYFTIGDDKKEIDLIAVFTSQNNNSFFKSLPNGKFNISDNNLTPILSNVTIDNPICNIDLKKGGNIFGRDKLVAGKYEPNFKKYLLLENPEFTKFKKEKTSNLTEEFIGKIDEKFLKMNEHFTNEINFDDYENKYLSFKTTKDCTNKDNKEIMKKIFKNNNFKLLEQDSSYLKDYQDILEKIIMMTGLKVRKHNSQEKYYYGGINENGEMVCLSKNGICNLYDNEYEVEQEKTKNNEYMRMDPSDQVDPSYIGDEFVVKYLQLINFNCIKEKKKISPCKHLINRKIVDIITFKNIKEINYVEELNKNKILDLHKLQKEKFIENKISDKDLEYKKAFDFNYLIESYDGKNLNLGEIFESFDIKLRIKDNLEKPPKSIITISENDNEITLKSNQKDLFLQKKDNIHIYIDKNLKLNIIVLRNDNIISSYISTRKLNGSFGEDINLFFRSNNTTILQNIFTSQKINNLTYPYSPFVKVSKI